MIEIPMFLIMQADFSYLNMLEEERTTYGNMEK
jgi:hypothetical protein